MIRAINLTVFVLIVITSPARADLLRVESETLAGGRRNANQNLEYPVLEFFQGSYITHSRSVEINTNFGYSRFADRHFSLYIMDAAFRPTDSVKLRLGRSFSPRTSLYTTSTDAAQLDCYLFNRQVTVGALGGIERKNLRYQLDSTSRFVGAHIDYRASGTFPLFFTSKFLVRRLDTVAPSSDQRLLGVALRQPFGLPWSPEFLANSEFNIGAQKSLNLAEAGFDFYPSYKTGLRLRGLIYRTESRDDLESPIFAIFSMGRLYEMSTQVEHQFATPFTASASFAYDNYEIQRDVRTSGYRSELGMKLRWGLFAIINSTYYFKTYGGYAYGDRIRLSQKLTNQMQLDLISDTTYYSKITSSKTFALNNEAWIGFWTFSHFKFDTGVEFDSNNTYRKDIRIATKLTYLLWKEL